jgi:hypothetical protein
VKDKKRAFIPYGFHIGFYQVKDTAQAKQEGLSQLEFWFQTGHFRKHDPKGLVSKHASQVSSCWPYAHDRFEDEIFTENAQDWDEVVARMADPKITKFKAMSWEEKATSLDERAQRAEEILRTREERVTFESTETMEAPQEAPVQNWNFLGTPGARERGTLLLQHAQQIMDLASNDLALLSSVPTSNPEESPTGVGSSELTDPGNINGSDDPESTLPPADSPAGATTQSKSGRVSVETSAPNPLSEFIDIYSDDESPEASQKTSVHVEEEKGAEEKTPLVPDVQSQEDTREEKGAESGLDTETPDAPETRAGSPKDKSELDVSKERSPQKDIGDATARIQASIELAPDTSIPLDTQVPDKHQEEVGPSEKNKEVQESDLEQIYTTDSLGNMLTWGDQQIPEPVDEVADIYAISYDQKRKAIMQRTAKKRKITVDHSILVTTEESLINTADARTSELIGVGRALSDAAQDRARRDERELAIL